MKTVELRSLVWSGIELRKGLSAFDPQVMKGRKIHVVQWLIRLSNFSSSPQHEITGQYELCFQEEVTEKANKRKRRSRVIRSIGYEGQTSGHGFRHQFSTVLNEKHWNKDAIEMQLAHVSGGTRSVYNHAAYLDTRKEMMQFWADWLMKR
jgi:integrase